MSSRFLAKAISFIGISASLWIYQDCKLGNTPQHPRTLILRLRNISNLMGRPGNTVLPTSLGSKYRKVTGGKTTIAEGRDPMNLGRGSRSSQTDWRCNLSRWRPLRKAFLEKLLGLFSHSTLLCHHHLPFQIVLAHDVTPELRDCK